MTGGKRTVLAVLGLVAVAALCAWLKLPELAGRLEALEGQVWQQALAGVRLPPAGAARAAAGGETAEAADAASAATAPNASVVDLFSADDLEAARAGRRVYYQFSDAGGAVHFVERFEDVPAPYRDRVGRIETGGREATRASRTPSPSQPRAAPARSAGAPPQRRPFAGGPEVVVYTAPWCGWCRKTLAHLDQKGVDYVEKDIDANPAYGEELMRKLGSRRTSIPVVEIDGELIRGHDPARIDALVGKSA